MNELAGEDFAGLDRFEARVEAVEKLRELGVLVTEEPYENNVGFSERADVPIEPRLSEQWFLKYPKTGEARAAVRERLIRFFPERWEKVYDHWLENIQDWCISRQLWWGHRIPVWYRRRNFGIVDRRSADPLVRCQIESPGEGWTQDPDVLDTWFSSWLWAHETMDEAHSQKVLSDERAGYRARHHLFLGRPDDHGRSGIHARSAFSACVFHGNHSRQTGTEDVQEPGQLAGSARLDRQVWGGRPALWPYAHRATGAGHSLRRAADR